MAVVFEHDRDLASVDAAGGIDLLDGQHHSVAAAQPDVGGGASDRTVRADCDGVGGDALLLADNGQREREQCRASGYEQPLHGFLLWDRVTALDRPDSALRMASARTRVNVAVPQIKRVCLRWSDALDFS